MGNLIKFGRVDDDPPPPTPVAPALPRPATTSCPACGGSSVDPDAGEPPPPAATFDRAAHCQRIGQTGGLVMFARYGSAHMRAIGKAGYAATVKAHGEQYARDLLRAKGWTPRRPDLLCDLRAGRALAVLAVAA